MLGQFLKTVNKAKLEARYWMWAAGTLPFVALAILFFEKQLGFEELYSRTLIVISLTFFSISVFWWWWAINKIVIMLESFNRTEQHFLDVKHELRETRKAIRGE